MLEYIRQLNSEGRPATTRAVARLKKCNYSYAAKELKKLWANGLVIKNPQGEWEIRSAEHTMWRLDNHIIYYLLGIRKTSDDETLNAFTERLKPFYEKEYLIEVKQAVELLLIAIEDAKKLPYIEGLDIDLERLATKTNITINSIVDKFEQRKNNNG